MPDARPARIAAVMLGVVVCFAPPAVFLLARFLASTGASRQGIVLLGLFGAVGAGLLCWGFGGVLRRRARPRA